MCDGFCVRWFVCVIGFMCDGLSVVGCVYGGYVCVSLYIVCVSGGLCLVFSVWWFVFTTLPATHHH